MFDGEQMHTIKLFLWNNSVFELLNLIQKCILLVTPFILFSQEGSNDKQIAAQKHVSSGRQFQSYWQKTVYSLQPSYFYNLSDQDAED